MAAATGVVSRSVGGYIPEHFSRMWRVDGTLDVASLVDAAGTTDTFTIAAAGIALGDAVVTYSASVDLAGVSVTAYVSAANVISVRIQNESAGTVDLASATWKFLVGRFAF